MARSNEPFLWSLFAAGGMVAAMLVPAHLLTTGILVPTGAAKPPAYDRLHDLFAHPLVRAYLVVLVSLPLFHAAHRLRFTLADLGLKRIGPLLAIVFYGGAVVGSVCAVTAVLAL